MYSHKVFKSVNSCAKYDFIIQSGYSRCKDANNVNIRKLTINVYNLQLFNNSVHKKVEFLLSFANKNALLMYFTTYYLVCLAAILCICR